MKLYEILDSDSRMFVGVLEYYEEAKTFIIELPEYLDEWTCPLMFAGLIKKGNFTVPREISLLWVRERIIPPGRQNISSILSHHHLKEYDEMKMLEISKGKCSQDSLYIKEISTVPQFVENRMLHNLTDCLICDENSILCFFADDTIRKVCIAETIGQPGVPPQVEKLAANSKLVLTGKITAGGYSITFNNQIDIPASVLYRSGVSIPLKREDFVAFVKNGLVDTSGACDLLECSRQNINYLIKQERIQPIKENTRGSLFMKGDLLRTKW